MLFNSLVFLLGFLPAALVLHALVERYRPEWRLPVLLALSFVFYGWWDIRFVPLLAASIVLNWLAAGLFLRTRAALLIPLAIGLNLLVLAAYKYLNFFADLANLIPGASLPHADIVLPLGISFFTFHHVMYLTDLRVGRAPPYDLVRYGLYIAFFPQVLAGPLVRWSEIMHQFEERPYLRSDAAERIGRGLMLLCVGLAKKVLIGDPLSVTVNPVFQAAAEGKVVTMVEAWQATLGFTFQIYFDFSGYTDMALGIALLFGVVLPQNFDAPYRAASLRDFWRRWHMTLSRFLRDYLYIPLGGNRRGLALQVAALFATMTLGGLWHGAGLTFVAWGAAHGLGLGAGLLWRRAGWPMPAMLGWMLTFGFVMLTWVFFRATSFEAALAIFKGLFGLAPVGSGFRWRTIALAAAIAILGPTAWEAVRRLPPSRLVAVLFATLFVVLLLKIGDDANYDFIYFQF
ncbi:MBOAT family O-acyltransferase [Methylobacterium iners]|uniref:Probable alginate O-acetylase AlgI n=1 Tax=Methylobacterium iners TaxID=418707 RepID=A0ABQ4RY73_9HYPH|nr:MBOAT family O-acyltransferase [Methylobacterium iners]GJD95796.1 Peptidoglycan O-acetyltransferase [Methylobacterium iners]